MSETQFTPGPWTARVSGGHDTEYGFPYVEVIAGGIGEYDRAFGPGSTDDGGVGFHLSTIASRFDGYLIAAAPDLYGALNAVVIHTIEESESIVRLRIGGVEIAAHSHDTPEGMALLKFDAEQRAILAKARGEA